MDPILGPIDNLFAGRWEQRNRPYGVRDFAPGTFRQPGGSAIDGDAWRRLAGGRALLFVHGTFSTAHAAFGQIPDAAFATLYDRYAGRAFAFNHFTRSHDPRQNVEWLLSQLPSDRPLEVDVVCHSRGGLVARTLAERPNSFALPAAKIAVKRVIFVGVPNHGTLLVDPDHMTEMIDRLTTALNVFPTGAVTEALEGLITAVKVIGHAALKSLSGLASMHPHGQFLRTLNQSSTGAADYYAIAADYTPHDQGLRALVSGAVDAVGDRVFEGTPNDLVVPEPGVYDANGGSGFPIDAGRVMKVPPEAGILHTTFFGYAPAIERLTQWLA